MTDSKGQPAYLQSITDGKITRKVPNVNCRKTRALLNSKEQPVWTDQRKDKYFRS